MKATNRTTWGSRTLPSSSKRWDAASPRREGAVNAADFASCGLSTPSAHSEGDWYNNIWLEIEEVKVH